MYVCKITHGFARLTIMKVSAYINSNVTVSISTDR